VKRFRFLVDLLAFSLPFLIGLAAAVWVMRDERAVAHVGAAAVEAPPGAKTIDTLLPTAVVLLDQDGVDAAGLLSMYGILSASGKLNVVTLGDRRQPISIAPDIGVLPDLSIQDGGSEGAFDRPKIVAIPQSLQGAGDHAVAWLRAHVTDSTWVLSSENNSQALAAAGLIRSNSTGADDAVMTPARRWMKDGMVITYESGTAAIDATLQLLSDAFGDSVARKTAEGFWYELQSDPSFASVDGPTIRDRIGSYLTAGFVWDKSDVAVALFDGIDEMRLAAVLDLYPRVNDSDVTSAGVTRRWFRSRHGLLLLPRLGIDEEPKIHELMLPGVAAAEDLDRFQAFCAEEEVPMYNPFGGAADSTFAYVSTLNRIAAIRGSGVARVVASAFP